MAEGKVKAVRRRGGAGEVEGEDEFEGDEHFLNLDDTVEGEIFRYLISGTPVKKTRRSRISY